MTDFTKIIDKAKELEAKMSTTHITTLIKNKRMLATKVNLKVS